MARPRFSIVTPSYNQAPYLERTLQSVMNQSYDNVEHIVVDGRSSDDTVSILEQYEDQYNLRWISESDRGQSHAVNKGLEMASGDWIGWQNSDDFYLSGAFEAVADAVEVTPDAAAVYGDLIIVDGDGNEVARQFMTVPSKFVQRYWSLFASNQSLFVRADVFEEIGGLNETYTYAMDADLMWKLLEYDAPLCRIGECLGAFRIQEDAKTYDNVTDEVQTELDLIYDHPWYEVVVPRPVLRGIAQSVKFLSLCRDGRWGALRYNLHSELS